MSATAKTIGRSGPETAQGDSALAPYDRDFYTWSLQQAELVRAKRFDLLDLDNVAEEIESLGREQFSKLASAYRVLLMHMLKWDFQPKHRSRSWAISIANQRLAVLDVLDENPGLKPRIAEALGRAFRRARLEAADETKLALRTFPAELPYSPEQVMTRPFDWPEP